MRSHVTPTGLLFAALSDEAPGFHEFFPELEPLLQRVDFTKLPYRRTIKYDGFFNWKTMYSLTRPLNLYIVILNGQSMQGRWVSGVSSLYLYPSSIFNLLPSHDICGLQSP